MARGSAKVGQDELDSPVTWRDGVHITGTSIWCDALRARDVCFVSSAERVRAAGHGQLIATAETIALLSGRGPARAATSKLPVPWNRPFTLGTRRLELVRSGVAVGTSSLLVTVDDKRVLYAGAVAPRGCGLDGPADVRACDTLIVSAEFGDPGIRFEDPARTADDVVQFATAVSVAGGVPIIIVDTCGKGLDVAARLSAADMEVAAHRTIHHAAQRLRPVRRLPPLRRWSGKPRPGMALLWLTRSVGALTDIAFPSGTQRAFVSGRAIDPASERPPDLDHVFAWADEADHDHLLEYIDATGARDVFLTHRFAEPLALALDSPTRRVRPLGPPRQMSLF